MFSPVRPTGLNFFSDAHNGHPALKRRRAKAKTPVCALFWTKPLTDGQLVALEFEHQIFLMHGCNLR